MCLSSQLNVTCVKYIPINSCMSSKNWVLADSCQAGYHGPRRGSHQVNYSTGHNLLMRWCAAIATAPNTIEHPSFQDFVAFVSNQCHKVLPDAGADTSGGSCALEHDLPADEECQPVCVPEVQFFANAYENWVEDTAANSAVAVNACLSDLLEVSPGARRPLQQGKVAGVTSDTANVMPATARELSQMPLFAGCIWMPCGCHVLNS
jgi:hypothetical protein